MSAIGVGIMSSVNREHDDDKVIIIVIVLVRTSITTLGQHTGAYRLSLAATQVLPLYTAPDHNHAARVAADKRAYVALCGSNQTR
jgi:hypothetical protein